MEHGGGTKRFFGEKGLPGFERSRRNHVSSSIHKWSSRDENPWRDLQPGS